jgi:penicillin-binding protein 1A
MPGEFLSILNPPPPRQAPRRRVSSRKIFGQFVFLILVLLSAGIGALGGLVFVYSSDLPQVHELEDYRPDVMTELYADDGTPVGSFALERRVIITYNQIPPVLRDAIISIEDRHFESHWGIDVLRIVRAAATDLFEWRKAQGASTLTQQLSRMLFLTPEKSFRRKMQEALLAIQIERHFTKPQIFTMYANQVPLGHGNFGFEAAAEFYFGKHLDQITLPEAALLAGIPRTPTAYSPILHPEAARRRRNQVLAAMLETGKIAHPQYREAVAAPLGLNVQHWGNTLAPYFVEEVRQILEKKYGVEAVQEKGLRVYTTLNTRMQKAAERALQEGLRNDDKRRGWRGPEKNILKAPPPLPHSEPATLETYRDEDWKKPPEPGSLIHGLVMEATPDHALVRFGELTARVTPPDFAWTKKSHADEVFTPGDLDLFLVKDLKGQTLRVTLDQKPDAQGAMLVIENSTGAIKALLGGYDWNDSKFDRALQAERQVGSSFKVYVYSQALLDGMSPFDHVLDVPVTYSTASGPWSPHDYDMKFEGDITLLHALAESRNVPAVRLLEKIGVDKVIKLCRRFGITSRLVPNLPLALGASDLTLLEHTSAFTTFPNDGVHIEPRMIYRVANYDGRVIDDFPPEVSDVLPAPVARLMISMLREVFNSGTAVGAKSLAEKFPLAGKTGTTNDFTDAWFIGFSPSLAAGVWVGFDDHHSLGPKEEGSRVALPIWQVFMKEVLQERPAEEFPHSPLLTSPEQVQQILASAAPERLLEQDSNTSQAAGNTPAPSPSGTTGSANTAGTKPAAATPTLMPVKETPAPVAGNPPPATGPAATKTTGGSNPQPSTPSPPPKQVKPTTAPEAKNGVNPSSP